MSTKHLKGREVNLLYKKDGSYVAFAASTSTDISITMNTTEASAKDDPGLGMWSNPAPTYYDWSVNNESFIVDVDFLKYLLDIVVNGDATIPVQIQGANNIQSNFNKIGDAVITNLSINAQNGEYAKITISLEGASSLSNGTHVNISAAAADRTKIRGKALMIAMEKTDGGTSSWKTFACATNHTLTVSCQTGDVMDKDTNDKAACKEVVSKSVTLSTENLIFNETNGVGSSFSGISMVDVVNAVTNGTSVALKLGYYPDSVGQSAGDDSNWGAPDETIISGTFICNSFNMNGGGVSDNATYSAEFQNQGAIEVEA